VDLVPWTTGPDLGIISASGIADGARRALERFRELRIPIPDNSRLERALTIVETANRDASSVSRDRLAEAIRTAYEMRWISRAFGTGDKKLSERLVNALACMLSGPDTESDDEAKLKPRSLQFELYIAALLTAGRVPVRYEEPDLLMEYLGEWVGIAVKLPRSARKVPRRIRDAADQIENRTPRGMVALNVDGLLDEATREGDDWTEIARQVDQLPELRDGLAELSKRPRIRGLLALGTGVRWLNGSDGRPRLEKLDFFKWHFLGHSDSEKQASEQFDSTFRAAFAKNASY
jgi:hypothetical protein